jgi:predicted nucleic acid-binding protein
MKYVIDCSTAMKWVVMEPDRAKAILLRDDFRNGLHELLAPDLFPVEIANALLVAERRKLIGPGDGAVCFADVMQTPPFIHAAAPFLTRTYEIAHRYQRTVYDCLYVALAEREQCEFVTADIKLVNALQAAFPFVVSLASMP